MKIQNRLFLFLILCCLSWRLPAQLNAKLLPDQLIFTDASDLFTTTQYSYLSLYLKNDFDEARVQPAFISVGDDLVFNRIDNDNGFQMIQTGVAIPNNNSRMVLNGLYLRRNFSGSTETWAFEKNGTFSWLTDDKTALRMARLETNTPRIDDRTALIIEPDDLKVGINSFIYKPPTRLSVFDRLNYENTELGAISSFKYGATPTHGSAVAGILNNSGDNVNATVTFAVGKLGGYWLGNDKNVGVHGHAFGNGAGGLGVIGSISNPNDTNTGINNPSGWAALGVQSGNSFFSFFSAGPQMSTSNNLWATSDRRLKRDIKPLTNALEMVNKLQPRTFKYRQDGKYKKLITPTETQYGFIAQEMEEVLPLLVREVDLLMEFPERSGEETAQEPAKTEAYKAIQSLGLIPVLTAAVKEVDEKYEQHLSRLETENRELQERVTKLEAAIEQLLKNKETATGSTSISSARLEQNIPNPSKGITLIKYEIPVGMERAELRIADASGKVILKQPIEHSGAGQIEVGAATLSAGSYYYSLYLNGELFDTRQMLINH